MNVLRQAAALGSGRSCGAAVFLARPLQQARDTPYRHTQQQPQQQQQQQQRWFDIFIDPIAISRQQRQQKNKKQARKSWKPSYRFVDRTRVRVSAGRGGKGSLSSQQMQQAHKLKPDGGHGGNGGSVVIVADPTEQTLTWSHPHVTADNGTNGTSQDCHGRNGKNRIMRVPCGVVVKLVLDHDEVWDELTRTVHKRVTLSEDGTTNDDGNVETVGRYYEFDEDDVVKEVEMLRQGLEIDVLPDGTQKEDYSEFSKPTPSGKGGYKGRETIVLADLDAPGSHLMVARGGRGGVGTCVYSSEHGPMPDANVMSQKAQPDLGEVAFLELELKAIADIGLVGFPNAGKSSLLRAMSQAAPEVAPYPFTTLHPIIGCIEYRDGFRVRAADIPGLIGGASEGRGRGHDFLRHIERTKALVYIVDAAGVDYRDPVEDLRILVNELASYGDGSLLERRALVVANKLDLLSEERIPEILSAIGDAAITAGIDFDHNVIGISAGVTGVGLSELSKAIRAIVTQSEEDRERELLEFQGSA